MSESLYWRCNICGAEATSNDLEVIAAVVKSHMNERDHYDFDFDKPKK